jgi:anti-sigma regulatory factor (Ser/Thr protein kinase)
VSGYIWGMGATTQGTRMRGVERHGPQGLRMRLGSGPDAAADARRAIAQLRADLDPPLMETLRLLVTELVTNSVRHTDCDSLTLRVAIGKSAVLTEVTDDGPSFDVEEFEGQSAASHDTDGGWGLFLVERLARDWGVKADDGSKRVWFELGRA